MSTTQEDRFRQELSPWEAAMERDEIKAAVDELRRQYDAGEIDGPTYAEKMMELTGGARE